MKKFISTLLNDKKVVNAKIDPKWALQFLLNKLGLKSQITDYYITHLNPITILGKFEVEELL